MAAATAKDSDEPAAEIIPEPPASMQPPPAASTEHADEDDLKW